MSEAADPSGLAQLRREIDAIDAEMHRLLIRRGEIIDRLIAVKRTGASGSAFRPAREAEMMRRLVARHRGRLPLDTVESIWRVIISTFTFVQAPYRVHADISAGEGPMRDVARFHFGFTVPYRPHAGTIAVIGAVEASEGDLGIVPVSAPGAWWAPLRADARPKIIARLPFVERTDHPAATPVFVLAKRIGPDAAAADMRMVALEAEGWSPAADAALAGLGGEVANRAPGSPRPGGRLATRLLLTLPGPIDEAGLARAVEAAGARIIDSAFVGSHAARYAVPDRRQTEKSLSS